MFVRSMTKPLNGRNHWVISAFLGTKPCPTYFSLLSRAFSTQIYILNPPILVESCPKTYLYFYFILHTFSICILTSKCAVQNSNEFITSFCWRYYATSAVFTFVGAWFQQCRGKWGGGRQPFFSLVTGFVGLLDLMMGGIKEMCTDLGVRLGVVTT